MSEHDDYIETRPLSWWREYMRGAIGIYEGMAKHPVTKSEKRALFARLKYNYAILGGVGSYTALAIMEHAFPRNEVNS